MRVWLYGGVINPDIITLSFLVSGNVHREYCFIDHKIKGNAEFVSEERLEVGIHIYAIVFIVFVVFVVFVLLYLLY